MELTKQAQMYEGKAKKVFATEDENYVIVSYKDDATANDGLKKGTISGKGVINNQMSNFLMQLQSDLLGIDIVRARSDEMTAMGAGLLAGLTTGFFTSLEELKGLYYSSKTYSPVKDAKDARKSLGEYKKAVKTAAFMASLEGESL